MDILEILHKLQISEKVFKKALHEFLNAFLNPEDESLQFLDSWEGFYSKIFKGKSPVEKKARLLVLVIHVNMAVDLLFETASFPGQKEDYQKKHENVLPEHSLSLLTFQVGLAGGMTYLADPVELINRLFTYLENFEKQKEKGNFQELSPERLALEFVSLGAVSGLFLLFEELKNSMEKEPEMFTH